MNEPPSPNFLDPHEMRLVQPSIAHLQGYIAALRAGWSPDNIRGQAAADEHLAKIKEDASAFVEGLHDPEGKGAPINMPDGSTVPRLPGYVRWIWDGDFCGTIGLRWVPGTEDLPPYCLGHIGYAVVPWKQGRGLATKALRQILPDARAIGLAYVEITTTPDNLASQYVVLANGGRLIEQFQKPDYYGGGDTLRFRITL